MSRQTHIEIEAITDEGLFEDLALSVLRISAPKASAIIQTGLNSEGRTHRAPFDGVGFVPGVQPDHLVAIHHTITARNGLRAKWLGEATAAGRPAGDVVKTIEIVVAERLRTPDLRATLLLTTSREPSDALVRDVRAKGRDHGLEVEIWSASRLAHVLDATADGQAVRRRVLGRPQDRLSRGLLNEIGRESLEVHLTPEESEPWVDRSSIVDLLGPGTRFLVGASGAGKTTACFQALASHITQGGLGLVLTAETVREAMTLEQALEAALLTFHPTLADGRAVLDWASSSDPLLLVVEDINRSGDGPRLAAKLAGWSARAAQARSSWRMLCPIWPELLGAMGEVTRKEVEALSVDLPPLTAGEAMEVVKRRASQTGRTLTDLQALNLAEAMGLDPLLIALHSFETGADPDKVIARYVEGSLQSTAQSAGLSAAALRGGLDAVMEQLILNRNFAPDWPTLDSYNRIGGGDQANLNALLNRPSVIGLTGPSTSAALRFRHDRVRDCLLVRAATRLEAQGRLSDAVVDDPAFTEVLGGALLEAEDDEALRARVSRLAPLALFDALSRCDPSNPRRSTIANALTAWIEGGGAEACSPLMRWSMAEKLGYAEGSDVPVLAKALGPMTLAIAAAALRNGDLDGGIYLAFNIEPTVRSPWRDRCIAHAWSSYRSALFRDLVTNLRDPEISEKVLCGVLRFVGHLGSPDLFDTVIAAWSAGYHTDELLDDYLWAATRSFNGDEDQLRPLYDVWGGLSDEGKDGDTPRSRVTRALNWPFALHPPLRALPFLTTLLARADLGYPIQFLLGNIDDPLALTAVAEAWAAAQRDRPVEEMNFGQAFRYRRWGNRRDTETQMSSKSRAALAALWASPDSNDALALASFELWSATKGKGDLALLSETPHRPALDKVVLRARLERGDVSAVPLQVEMIRASPHPDYWWQFGRHVWSPELTNLLDETLPCGTLHLEGNHPWLAHDWIQSELIMNLDLEIAEGLLARHWGHLRQSPHFFQVALYIATPKTLELAAEAIAAASEPREFLRFLSMHYGYHAVGARGITRQAQIRALEPYLSLMEDREIEEFAEACNQLGWHALRREVFDPTGRSGRADIDAPGLLAKFEEMKDMNRGRVWLDHAVQQVMETGWTWPQILTEAVAWTDQTGSPEAAEVLASLIRVFGERRDLTHLEPLAETFPGARQAIEDAFFTVKRRSLR